MLSIIIPTYNERDNVNTIAERIGEVLQDSTYEIIFVDDSKDDTPEVLSELAKRNPHVRFEHRTNEKGLGTAVVRGFELANGTVLTVMDADLQHPPGMLVSMMKAINTGADVVIPSRFIPGGDDGGLNIVRKVISATARYMGKFALKSLRKINDPTSGFFMFRKEVIKGVKLRPIGWKILIEVLARGTYEKVIELPYRFEPRLAGESKMSLTEQWNYIKHLYILVKESPIDRRFFRFAFVGLSGVLVNMLVYALIVRIGFSISIAGTLSAFVAMCSNFFLNDRYTWAEIKSAPLIVRISKFFTTSLFGIGVSVLVLNACFHVFHMHYLLSNLFGIIVGTGWNFLINNFWTYRVPKPSRAVPFVVQWSSKQLNL